MAGVSLVSSAEHGEVGLGNLCNNARQQICIQARALFHISTKRNKNITLYRVTNLFSKRTSNSAPWPAKAERRPQALINC